MKKYVISFIVFVGVIVWGINLTMPANAAKKNSRGGGAEKQIKQADETISKLTKKFYTRALFSPEDSDNLITVKLTIDSQMDVSAEPALAPIYFKTGHLFKLREMNDEAIDCFQTILENFGDTVYAPKARQELREMGVDIKETLTINAPKSDFDF